jgi:hypothetical protein
MEHRSIHALPHVPVWRLNLIRFMFILIAFVMGGFVWPQLLFGSANWHWGLGMGKSMLAALALLSLLGIRYPLQMLPLMLYELAWKTIWMASIAFPAWVSDRMTPDLEDLFFDCVGVVIVFFVIPWRYVWARYVQQPGEPWRAASTPAADH